MFGYCQSVIDLNSEIANRTLDLGMAEQQLDGPQIASAAVDQRCLFRRSECVSERARIEPDAAYLVADGEQLSGRETPVLMALRAEKVIASLPLH